MDAAVALFNGYLGATPTSLCIFMKGNQSLLWWNVLLN